jgi:hypothetical protein
VEYGLAFGSDRSNEANGWGGERGIRGGAASRALGFACLSRCFFDLELSAGRERS